MDEHLVKLYSEYLQNKDEIALQFEATMNFIVGKIFQNHHGWKLLEAPTISSDNKFFHIRVHGVVDKRAIIDGKIIHLTDNIPVEWLYIKDWEDQLASAIKAYDDEMDCQAEARKLLKTQALAKLTYEEKEVLGLNR